MPAEPEKGDDDRGEADYTATVNVLELNADLRRLSSASRVHLHTAYRLLPNPRIHHLEHELDDARQELRDGFDVPGFRIREPGERGRGRPSNIGTAEEIVERVELFREILPLADKKGLKRACEIMSNRRGSRCYGVKPATLRKMVTDAKRASADDLSNFAFRFARSTVDLGILGALSGGDDDEADTRAGSEVKRRVRRK